MLGGLVGALVGAMLPAGPRWMPAGVPERVRLLGAAASDVYVAWRREHP
ncbi:MAG TPA: hypothetical protein VEZ47_00545 [Gemmatirosa sp.]|nr:hypothetical protein [Gemmatirosa sp.]